MYDQGHKYARVVDLRGIESVEGRIRRALVLLVGFGNYANIQVSSRTDRGVHAWRNTFQVDIRPRLQLGKVKPKGSSDAEAVADRQSISLRPTNLVNGLNFHLARLPRYPSGNGTDADRVDDDGTQQNTFNRHDIRDVQFSNDICILSSSVAPSTTIPNERYDPSLPENDTNPKKFPWDVRFSATRRTYAYQILHSFDDDTESGGASHYTTACYQSQPFEHDRVWRIHEKNWRKKRSSKEGRCLDIDAMNVAGQHLVGTHDFTSFRGKGCQRSSPVVTLEDVWVSQERYHGNYSGGTLSAVWRRKLKDTKNTAKDGILPVLHTPKMLNLVTIVVTGKSFVYHQVRNIVACLVDVGRGHLQPDDVREILEKRDRRCAPGMAPAKGLFLVDVEHGDFRF